MPTQDVILGAYYKHDNTFRIMRLEAASAPECDNHVDLIDPNSYCKQGFINMAWRGSWEQFLQQWSQVEDEYGHTRTNRTQHSISNEAESHDGQQRQGRLSL